MEIATKTPRHKVTQKVPLWQINTDREPLAGLLIGSGKRVEQGDPVRAPMEKRKMEGREG